MKDETATFPAALTHLAEILSWIRLQLSKAGMQKGDRLHVELAMEEAVVNVINHTEAQHSFEIRLTSRINPGRHIEFELADPGPPYNPLAEAPPSNENLPIEEIEEGGLGLVLIHKCMDALFYRREDGHNILTLIKNLDFEELI